jgi:hypothetical protein
MGKRESRHFTLEFKRNAVALLIDKGLEEVHIVLQC